MTTQETTLADKIIEACEARWDANKGDCSGFVRAVALDLGFTLTGQANTMIDFLEANWRKATDGPDAAAKAAAGMLVIGGLKAQPNGHVVVVVSGPLNRALYPTAYWGQLGGVGRKNTTINWSWSATDRDNVSYWYADPGAVTASASITGRVIGWSARDFLRRAIA